MPPTEEFPPPVASENPPAPAPTRLRQQVHSHFVFGPGFTQALLIVCILMLGIIIGMRLGDYFHNRGLEQSELALLRASQESQGRTTRAATTTAPEPASVAATPQPVAPAMPSVSAPAQPVTTATLLHPPAPGAPAPRGTNRAPNGAASADYTNELALLQQERDLMRQRFENLNTGTGTGPDPGSAPGSARSSAAEPPASSSALPAPRSPKSAGGTRTPSPTSDVEALRAFGAASAGTERVELSAAEQRIHDAPSLGKVLEYDPDWHFVVISCGTKHNLEAGRKLAIRRGGSILGLIHVEEILPDQSVAELEGEWKTDPKSIKPQAGDDVLTYPPF